MKVGQGDTTKTFAIHKGILCFYSGYFEAGMNGNFAESRNNLIELPTEDIGIFERVVPWLYTSRINLLSDTHSAFAIACAIWIFADRRVMPLLADTMIDAIGDAVVESGVVPTTRLHYIYHNTTPDAKLRKFVVMLISRMHDSSFLDTMTDEQREEWPREAMWDVMQAVWAAKDRGVWNKMTKTELEVLKLCEYHQHDQAVDCTDD